MRFRYVVLLSLGAALMLILSSCEGGGSAMGALSIVPKGDYYMIEGSNPAQKYNSPIFKDLADEVRKFEDESDDWEDDLSDMGVDNPRANSAKLSASSEDYNENVTFIGGPFRADDLEDYYEDEKGWTDWDEDERKGRKYYTGKLNTSEMAALLERGGVFTGKIDTIDDAIDVIVEGDKKLVDEKKFKESRNLVDFGASEYMLQWDNIDGTISSMKSMFSQVDDDDDIKDAWDDLRAQGVSVYWSNTLRVVTKFKFRKDKHVETLFDFFKKDMDEVFEKLGPALVTGMFGSDANTRDLDELADKARVNRRGTILEITFEMNWKDLEEIID